MGSFAGWIDDAAERGTSWATELGSGLAAATVASLEAGCCDMMKLGFDGGGGEHGGWKRLGSGSFLLVYSSERSKKGGLGDEGSSRWK
ncbi:hypothetical protein M0R45_009079 [Rubus argutus]|uniref:Uncharacterized protein n=1 Tax=Rubus argutus TaxID=59490 RepID=A0AAW1Y6Y6_RUBAR